MKEKEASKLYNSITNVNNQFINEAQIKTKKKKNGWLKLAAMAACLVIAAGIIVPKLNNPPQDEITPPFVADAAPMVYVNDTLYRIINNQPDITGKESQLVYLGTISSKVSSSQYPQENFQANDDIVGSAVYQFGEDIVVEIDGQYWIYCAVLDIDYTANDDGTYTCRGNTYKYMIEVSGVDGETQIAYIILTNNKETSFEDVSCSLRKAEISTETPEFVILGWYY